MVVLDKRIGNADFLEFFLMIRFQKESTPVIVHHGSHFKDAQEGIVSPSHVQELANCIK